MPSISRGRNGWAANWKFLSRHTSASQSQKVSWSSLVLWGKKDCFPSVLLRYVDQNSSSPRKQTFQNSDRHDRCFSWKLRSYCVAIPIIWIKKYKVHLQCCQIGTFYKYWFFCFNERGVILQVTGNVPSNNCKLNFILKILHHKPNLICHIVVHWNY